MHEVKERIREFILEHYLEGEFPANLHDNTRLRTSRILDPFATLELIDFVEREFQVELPVYESGVESFDCIDDLANRIAHQQPIEQGQGRRSAWR